jgi:ATP-dependent DNA helicase RecQ
LRIVRRKLADERDVPVYVIFSDASLREMARLQPTTRSDFGRIAGVGEQKLRDFAEAFTASIKDHLSIRSPK